MDAQRCTSSTPSSIAFWWFLNRLFISLARRTNTKIIRTITPSLKKNSIEKRSCRFTRDGPKVKCTIIVRVNAVFFKLWSVKLLGIRNSVDQSCMVIGNQERAIGQLFDIYRPSEYTRTIVSSADKRFVWLFSSINHGDSVARCHRSVSRTVLSDKNIIIVWSWKLCSFIKFHAECSNMRSQIHYRCCKIAARTAIKLRILNGSLVAERVAEVLRSLLESVEFINRHIVTHLISSVIGKS